MAFSFYLLCALRFTTSMSSSFKRILFLLSMYCSVGRSQSMAILTLVDLSTPLEVFETLPGD